MRRMYGFRAAICMAGLTALLVLAGCSRNELTVSQDATTNLAARAAPGGTTAYYGPVSPIGQGHIRSYGILENQTHKPLALGFQLSAGALHHLPDGHSGNPHVAYVVKLHPKVQSSGIFDHLVADWNPQGHMPGPYLPAHFDFHFYLLTQAQRMQITANDPLSTMALPAGYLPADYVGPVGPEPQMGGHCVDLMSPELNGHPFTHTFIYGAYNGRVAFYEPMITHQILASGTSGDFPIRQPLYYSKSGYYPTRYSIHTDTNGNRYVELSNFEYRTAQ